MPTSYLNKMHPIQITYGTNGISLPLFVSLLLIVITLLYILHVIRKKNKVIELLQEEANTNENELNNLQSTATRYQNSFINSPAAMAVLQLTDGKILDCNTSFEILTGFSKSTLVSSPASAFNKGMFHSADQLNEILLQLKDKHKLYNIEVTLNNINGDKCITLGSFEVIYIDNKFTCFATFIDITAWKKTEQALIDSENFAYAALDSLSSQIAILDESSYPIYTNTFWNENFAELFSSKMKSETGIDLLTKFKNNYSNAEYFIQFAEAINSVISGTSGDSLFEFSVANNDTTHWYACRISRFTQSEYLRIIISIDNITVLRKAELEKIQSEIRYQAIFENALEGIFQCDPQGNFLTVNQALATISGYASPAELLMQQKDLSTLMGFNSYQDSAFHSFMQTNRSIKGIECNISQKPGETKQLMLKAHPVFSNSGELLRIEGTVEDITERKKAELALENSEYMLRTIFENTKQAFILLDKELNILNWNHKAQEEIVSVTGLHIRENTSITEYIPRRYISDFKDMIAEVFEGKHLTKQIKVRSLNGDLRWFEITLVSYQNDIGMEGFILSSTDITMAKASEERINNQVGMLQKTNHELDKFVYSVSHDLRAPLTSILGLINIAMYETSKPVLEKHLNMISSCVNRLDGFIQDILNYSRNSRQEINSEPVNFRQLLAETRSDLKHMNGENRIRIKGEINDFTPFHSDALRISIILNNLLANAIKYSDPEKADSYIEVTINTEPSRCTINISDNGIGIDAEHQNKVFEMFYRVSHSIPGAGLGLYIVKETVAKLHGTIKLQSKVGRGSAFVITLPDLSDLNTKKRISNEFNQESTSR
ncbi:MAG: PAS domain-containing sensor histidine kinase [Bacteroidota bacterium]